MSQGRVEDNSAFKPSGANWLSCVVASVHSCLFNGFSLLDTVFKQVSPFGPVFLQIYLEKDFSFPILICFSYFGERDNI